MSSSPQQKSNKSTGLQHKIMFLESIRRGQEPLWNDPRRGLAIDPSDKDTLTSLQRESLNQNLPFSLLLDDSSFNHENLRQALITIVYEMNELEIEPDMDPYNLVKQLSGGLPDLIVNVLKQNQGYFSILGDRVAVSPLVLYLIGGALIQPSMFAFASCSDRQYLDAWEMTSCPICGRLPSVAVKTGSEAWRFRCAYCQAEYRMDINKCPHCGSEGFDNKEFLLVGENQELEVAYCQECSRYFKIINKTKLRQPFPEGYEDLYTEVLDDLARERGLLRIDDETTEDS
jgi:formate dehydrogenase maturation protein FdhE